MKIVGILTCILFVGASFLPNISGNMQELEDNEIKDFVNALSNLNSDSLDQYCDEGSHWSSPIHSKTKKAQSFKPTLTELTRVELHVMAYGAQYITQPLKVSIRNDLDGTDLTSISVSPDQIPSFDWYNFNFEDITVIPEQTYYIVLSSNQASLEHYYLWSGGEYIDNDPYTRGRTWFSSQDNGWIWECCEDLNPYYDYDIYCDGEFKTYGYSEDTTVVEIGTIKASFGVSTNIINIGTSPAYDVSWSIDVEPSIGLILSGSHTENTIDEILAGGSDTIESSGLRGIGLIAITVEVADVVKQATGFLLGPLVLRVNEI